MNWYCTYADELSIWPVAQQIIGVATAVKNICLIGRDILEKVSDFCISFFSIKELTTHQRAEQEIRSVKRVCEAPEDFTEKDEFYIRDQIEPNILRRVAFIAVGCIRATPLLGTFYSLYVVCNRPSYLKTGL